MYNLSKKIFNVNRQHSKNILDDSRNNIEINKY